MPSVVRLRQRVFGRRSAVDLTDVCKHEVTCSELPAFFDALMLSAGCADAAGMCVLAAACTAGELFDALCVGPPQIVYKHLKV